ncbi:unnamed protein product [Sphenostylis stenocarpa]|uniref:Uncharacterized protein n=1 Tax=Sphenostylis stenocarpa TaxID=92480 RepID=A0AA86T2X9_9FABA|nr:unnamed protein product [Sphenostylis stenocarpa]
MDIHVDNLEAQAAIRNAFRDFTPSHKCKHEFMLYIAKLNDPKTNELDVNNLLNIDDPTPNEKPEPLDTTPTQISLNALMGHSIP